MSSKRIPHRAIARMTDSRWAIREDALGMMLSIANREDLSALADRMGSWKETQDGDVLEMRGNVAIIEISGPCFRYSNLMTEFCGATSYEAVARKFRAAQEDTSVEAIIPVYNTPGGEVTGCAELAMQMSEWRGNKPVVAYVDGDACSAGYWLASTADHIVISSTGQAGCLGVVGVYTDRRQQNEAAGIKQYEIVSQLTPNKRPDPATDEGYAELLRSIDDTADVFLTDIGKYRGIKGSPKAIAKKFQGGGVHVGQKAVDLGLADEVGTFEDLVALLNTADDTSPSQKNIRR